MKKLVLSAAFTLIGAIAISAQTEKTTPHNPSQNTNNQTTTSQTQQKDLQTSSGTAIQNQNTTATATLETAPLTVTEAKASVAEDIAVDSAKSADATKEDRKSKKKKLK